MSVFLSQVHAIVEDSLVFVALGAAALWVVGFRLRLGGRGDRASGRGRRRRRAAPRRSSRRGDQPTPRRRSD